MDSKKSGGLNTLKRIFFFTRPYKGRLISSITPAITLAILAPVRPYLIQYSVDHFIMKRLLEGLVLITVVQVGILLAETLLRFVFHVYYQLAWPNGGQRSTAACV